MAIGKIPIPKLIYRSIDQAGLPDQLGERLINGNLDELDIMNRRPGLKPFADTGSSFPITGLFWWDIFEKVIVTTADGSIFQITSPQGVTSDITGDKLLGSSLTYFDEDRSRTYMANGGKIVTFNNTGTTSAIADVDAPTKATHVVFLDGYIIATVGGQKFQWSKLLDGTDWNALDFASAEGKPDDLRAILVANRELYMFGDKSIEIWQNDGVTPFSRVGNIFFDFGVIAIDSIVNVKGALVFLNSNRRLTGITGRGFREFSTPFDNIFRDITPLSDVQAMWLPIGSREYYVMNFPNQNRTFVHDLTTEDWAEWGEWDSRNFKFDLFRGKTHTYARAWDLHLVGDKTTGKVYSVDPTKFQDDTVNLRTLMLSGHISHGTSRYKRSNVLRIRAKRGVGLQSPVTDEPKLLMRFRDDNQQFGNEIEVSLGKFSDTEFYRELTQLGIYRSRQWEFVLADNANLALIDIEEEFDILTS